MSGKLNSSDGFDPAALTLSTFFRVGTIAFLIVVFQVLADKVFSIDYLLLVLMAIPMALFIYALSIVEIR